MGLTQGHKLRVISLATMSNPTNHHPQVNTTRLAILQGVPLSLRYVVTAIILLNTRLDKYRIMGHMVVIVSTDYAPDFT